MVTASVYGRTPGADKGGELRFGFDSLKFDPDTGTPVTVPLAYPYQMVDGPVAIYGV